MNTSALTYQEYATRRDASPVSVAAAASSLEMAPARPMPALPRSLPEFAASDAVLLIDAPLLGDGAQALVAGEAADVRLWRIQHPNVDNTVPVYRGSELYALLEVQTAGAIKMIHEIKSVFGGRLLADGEPLHEVTAKGRGKQ